MRLFKLQGSCPKQEPMSTTDDSQKSWGVLRFFQSSASGCKEAAAAAATAEAAAAAAASICPQESRRKQLQSDSLDDGSPANYSYLNQNYTPEVALSLESRPITPAELPLQQAQFEDSPNMGGGAAASGAPKSNDLERYQHWQQRKPRFRLGPRLPEDDEMGDGSRRASKVSSASSAASENVITLPARFTYIYQDGKFVEREVNRWPKLNRALPHQRYRIQEPYASRYGRLYKQRLSCQGHIVSQKERCIYHNPIFRLPRKIMEENKCRLMTRHCLKESFEGPKATTVPQKININEQEQSKIVKQHWETRNHKEAEKLGSYMTAAKIKAAKPT